MFNPHARWARPGPKAKKRPGESIDVVARFSPGKIRPLYLILNNRKYSIQRVNYFWKDYLGGENLYCFSVSDGTNIFQIYFSNRTLSWRLAKIE